MVVTWSTTAADAAFDTTALERTITRERSLVEDAIALVASGATRRVLVGGLRLGEQLLPGMRALARGRRVAVRPLWVPGDEEGDLVVETMAPEGAP